MTCEQGTGMYVRDVLSDHVQSARSFGAPAAPALISQRVRKEYVCIEMCTQRFDDETRLGRLFLGYQGNRVGSVHRGRKTVCAHILSFGGIISLDGNLNSHRTSLPG